jgi:plasmid stabilization system protein ParE
MKVRFTAEADTDLRNIGDYIAADTPERAITFVAELREHSRQIGAMPHAFPAIGERGGFTYRRHRHGRYLICYRVRDGEVEVVRVLHGARDYERLILGDD